MHFEKAYSLKPDEKEIARSLAGCLGNLGRLDEAIRVLDEYLGRHPDDAIARKLRSEINAARR